MFFSDIKDNLPLLSRCSVVGKHKSFVDDHKQDHRYSLTVTCLSHSSNRGRVI